MPAPYRLSRVDFARMRGFRRLSGTLFSLSWGVIEGREMPGGACVISAKTASRANIRNTVKRRCRTILVPVLKGLRDPLVLVFHAKKGAGAASMAEMRLDITELIRRAGIETRDYQAS